MTRDIGDPTPEIAEQVGEDGFGQRKGLLVPKILLDHTKAKPGWRGRFGDEVSQGLNCRRLGRRGDRSLLMPAPAPSSGLSRTAGRPDVPIVVAENAMERLFELEPAPCRDHDSPVLSNVYEGSGSGMKRRGRTETEDWGVSLPATQLWRRVVRPLVCSRVARMILLADRRCDRREQWRTPEQPHRLTPAF